MYKYENKGPKNHATNDDIYQGTINLFKKYCAFDILNNGCSLSYCSVRVFLFSIYDRFNLYFDRYVSSKMLCCGCLLKMQKLPACGM